MIANEIGKKLYRNFVTWVGRDLMNSVGGFVETLASMVDGFRLAFYLRPIRSRDDVPNNRAGMTVGWIGFSRSVSNLNNGHLQMVPI